MKAKYLIELLQQADPEADVLITGITSGSKNFVSCNDNVDFQIESNKPSCVELFVGSLSATGD